MYKITPSTLSGQSFVTNNCPDCGCEQTHTTNCRRFETSAQAVQEAIQEYTNFLEKCGYVDSDVWSEKPTAVERFIGGER